MGSVVFLSPSRRHSDSRRHTHWCRGGVLATKLKNLPKLWSYPFGDFHQISTVCGQLHERSFVKIGVDSLRGFQSYGRLNLGGVLPKMLSAH